MAKGKNKRKSLEVKYEELDQYDGWSDEVLEKWQGQYAYHIGKLFIAFSALEHSLEVQLANLINERGHDEGLLMVKDLEMQHKIELFYNLSFQYSYFKYDDNPKRRTKLLTKLTSIRKQLETSSELRNKVAHAKWTTLDDEGYVRVDTKTDKNNGLIRFRKFKMTASILHNASRRMLGQATTLEHFVENELWD